MQWKCFKSYYIRRSFINDGDEVLAIFLKSGKPNANTTDKKEGCRKAWFPFPATPIIIDVLWCMIMLTGGTFAQNLFAHDHIFHADEYYNVAPRFVQWYIKISLQTSISIP